MNTPITDAKVARLLIILYIMYTAYFMDTALSCTRSLRVESLSSSASLGDRIHRNIHAVQRTSAKLDSKFLSK